MGYLSLRSFLEGGKPGLKFFFDKTQWDRFQKHEGQSLAEDWFDLTMFCTQCHQLKALVMDSTSQRARKNLYALTLEVTTSVTNGNNKMVVGLLTKLSFNLNKICQKNQD